jgi:hypothetical protein
MSHQQNGNGPPDDAVRARLVVVRVQDTIEPKLTALTGMSYQSPPQSREQAMTLVRLLLGCSEDPPGEEQCWTAAIAGGRRVVTLTEGPRR